ncbi:MAG: hypothetical protein QOJ26_737 [Thermoplasmata archaeon]|jgi:hypothetical protein|nr:hypothetical protein [Thermoplasmata archaeon]
MRSWLAVAVLLLAGCAAPEKPPAEAESPAWIVLDPVVFIDESVQWHGVGGSNAFEYYDLASQAVAHPCLWDGSGGTEPYFNNRQLPLSSAGLGPLSGNVTFTLDWTMQDWTGSALRIAYRAPGLKGWEQTGPIERGTDHIEPIALASRNATADADAEVVSDWSVWVCLPTDTLEPEQPFVGSFHAKVVFVPDPVLESDLAPAEPGDERTARGG